LGVPPAVVRTCWAVAKIDPSEYVLSHHKNKPVITFRRGLSAGTRIEVDGETPNKPPKGQTSHQFDMKLK